MNFFFSFLIRLHNYSTRSDSLDLRVVDVPKLISTTYQLKEQINKILDEQTNNPLLPANGDILSAAKEKERSEEQQTIRCRIDELELELNRLKTQLVKLDHL